MGSPDEKDVEKEKDVEPRKERVTWTLALSVGACCFGSSFQNGYQTGVVNVPEKVVEAFINETVDVRTGSYISHSLLTSLWAVVVSVYCAGGMIGGVSAGYFANKFGRKGSLLLINILIAIAVILTAFAKMAESYEMLIAGRFLFGINAGISSGIVPMYLAETAPTSLRGLAGTMNQLSVVIAILLAQLWGQPFTLGTTDLWPLDFAFPLVPMLFQLCLFPFCPETPRYLTIKKEMDDKAREGLVWLRGREDVEDEMKEMIHERAESKNTKPFTLLDLLRDPFLRHALIISIVMQFSQQFSGINAVIFYSTQIFRDANLTPEIARYATLGTGAVNVAMTFVSAMLVDRAGRRTLHLIGLGGMFVFTLILALSLIFQGDVAWLSYVSIGAVTLYIVSFATGPGSIPWFIVSELFAQNSRPSAVSVATFVNWLSNFSVGLGFPEIKDVLGPYTFIIFVVLLFLFFVFTFFKVPETKGKSIEEIQALFKTKEPPEIYTELTITQENPEIYTEMTITPKTID